LNRRTPLEEVITKTAQRAVHEILKKIGGTQVCRDTLAGHHCISLYACPDLSEKFQKMYIRKLYKIS
jgi:hypothetical protein